MTSGKETVRERNRTNLHLRGLTSLTMTTVFLILCFSGITLYFTPRCRVANWTNWQMLGLRKEQWAGIHISAAWSFVVCFAFHLYFNWKTIWSYIKKKAESRLNQGRELAVAAGIGAFVVTGSLCTIPPFGTVLQWNDAMKNYWARTRPVAPLPRAETMRLEEIARHIGVTPKQAAAALKTEGFPMTGPEMTLADIAGKKGVPPSDVFKAIQKHHPQVGRWRGFRGRHLGSQGRGRRFGRRYGRWRGGKGRERYRGSQNR